MSAEESKATIRRAIDRWNSDDLAGYLEIYSPDVVLRGYQGVEPGIESVTQYYQGILAAFPGSRITIEDEVAEGDKVALRFVLRGTHQGDLMGIPPTGKPVTISGITVLRFAGGKCVERWSQADFLGMLQQIGAIPASA